MVSYIDIIKSYSTYNEYFIGPTFATQNDQLHLIWLCYSMFCRFLCIWIWNQTVFFYYYFMFIFLCIQCFSYYNYQKSSCFYSSCYFDGIKGSLTNIFFTTVPLLLVVVVNTILYFLTWKRIHDQTRSIKQSMTTMSANMRASHRAARAMSMFVAAFFIQWWAMALYGIWGLADEEIPQVLFHLVTTFSNIGGCLNLVVYILIRRKQLSKGEHVSIDKSKDSESRRRAKHTLDVPTNDISLSEYAYGNSTGNH